MSPCSESESPAAEVTFLFFCLSVDLPSANMRDLSLFLPLPSICLPQICVTFLFFAPSPLSPSENTCSTTMGQACQVSIQRVSWYVRPYSTDRLKTRDVSRVFCEKLELNGANTPVKQVCCAQRSVLTMRSFTMRSITMQSFTMRSITKQSITMRSIVIAARNVTSSRPSRGREQ